MMGGMHQPAKPSQQANDQQPKSCRVAVAKAAPDCMHSTFITFSQPPQEADKRELMVAVGLDREQINNWFINQRKRHWLRVREHNLHTHLLFWGGGRGSQ